MVKLRDMTSLKKTLSKLNINSPPGQKLHKCPSMTRVRKAYKEMVLNHHPDKGGNNDVFQGITEAYRDIKEYMNANPDNVDEDDEDEMKDIKEKEDDIEYCRIFKETVKIFPGNVTFKIKPDEANLWMKSFVTYFDNLNAAKKEDSAGGLKFSDLDWKVPGNEDSVGSLHVTIWTSSKNPSVLVQGSHYLAFVALVLPRMAKTLGKNKDKEIIAKTDEETEVSDKETENVSIERISVERAFHLFDSLVSPVALYACEVWYPHLLPKNCFQDKTKFISSWETMKAEKLISFVPVFFCQCIEKPAGWLFLEN